MRKKEETILLLKPQCLTTSDRWLDVELNSYAASSLSLRNLTLMAGSQETNKLVFSFWQVFARTHPAAHRASERADENKNWFVNRLKKGMDRKVNDNNI